MYSEAFKKTFKEKFLQLLESNAGNIKHTLKSTNSGAKKVRRSTLYNWLKEDPDFREELDEINEGWIDNVESAIRKEAMEGNVTAQIFLLKTQAKHRGYVEAKEVTKRKIKVTVGDNARS